MWESLDLRKFPRLALKCDIEIHEAKNALHHSTVTQNIGAGGVCVILPWQLSRFASVIIRLHLNDGQAPVECSCKICWVVQSRFLFRNDRQYDTGLEFLDIKIEERQRVKQLVERRLGQS